MGEKKNMVTERENVSTKSSFGIWLFLIVILFGALIGYQQKEIQDLKQLNETFETDIRQDLSKNMAQMKKVYVYNLEETLKGVELEKLNQEFEEKLKILNDEVSIAQEKISSLEDTKDKDTFSDIYLQSLKLKRDTMLQEYNRSLEDLTNQVNQAISQIAKEKDASVILDVRAVASLTENVEDVTDEVIKKVKIIRPKTMDE